MNRSIPLALLVVLSPLACRKAPVETPSAWTPQLTAADQASLCEPDGSACAPTTTGASLAGKRLTTSATGTAGVTLDHETRLELGPGAAVTFLPGPRRTIEVTGGVAEVKRLPSVGTPDAPPIAVKMGDQLATLDGKSPTTLVLRVRSAGRAIASVDRGVTTFRRGEAPPVELHAGETATLADGQPLDRRAGYAGEVARVEVPKRETTPKKGPPRGLGTMTARVPGTTEVVSGVRLASHKVHTVIRNGFARTEVEEEFSNDSDRVLEGRYVFAVPPRATVARLALWVGDKLVEDEVVPRAKAAAVFKGIVDDTVRPRDPALLEWVASGEVSLKIFPMPAKGTRRVVLAYDEALSTNGGEARWAYPLSLGEGRENRVASLSIAVDVEGGGTDIGVPGRALGATIDERGAHVAYEAKDVSEASDFVVTWREKTPAAVETAAYVPSWGAPTGMGLERLAKAMGDGSWVAVRLTAGLPPGAEPPAFVQKDRVLVVDRSFSQSRETLDGAMRVAIGLARSLDPDERFAVLACDAGCEAYPPTGLAAATEASFEALEKWAKATTPGGSSDVAGALLAAASRVEPNGRAQVVYLGDGAATSGELSATTIATRTQRALSTKKVDLRLVGAGVTVDAAALEALGGALSATVEPLTTGASLDARIEALASDLRRPVIHGAKVTLPASITEVYPATLPALRLGQQVLLVGKLARPEGDAVTLTGELDGKPYSFSAKPVWGDGPMAQTPLVPRLWASRRIDALRTSGDAAAAKEIVDLSQRFHVLTPLTSLLVLENDAMFAEMGIARTVPRTAAMQPGVPGSPSALNAQADALQMQALSAFGPGSTQGALQDAPAGLDAASKTASGVGNGGGLAGIGATGTSGIGVGSTTSVAGPRGNVTGGAPSVTGGTIANAARVLAGARARMRACYQQGLANDPTQEGRMSLTIRVGPNGEVVNVSGSATGSISAQVAQCVQARARSLQFDAPEGGASQITVAFSFVQDKSAPPPPPQQFQLPGPRMSYGPPPPSAVVRASDDTWRTDGEPALQKLREALEKSPTSRQKLEALIRGLLVRGRFDVALTEARRFADADPDLPVARDLLAYASIATGDPKAALEAVDAAVETEARSIKAHLRAAQAFEGSGDERRACAHWRSLAELTRDDAYAAESFRCRVRALGDRDAIGDAKAIEKPGAKLAKMIAALESPPAFAGDAGGLGQIEVTVECAGGNDDCPTPIVIAPNGVVFSPATPADARATPRSIAFSSLRDGTYHVVLVGGGAGAQGQVLIRALGTSQKLPFTHGGLQSIASAQVNVPPQCCWGSGLDMIGFARIGGGW